MYQQRKTKLQKYTETQKQKEMKNNIFPFLFQNLSDTTKVVI